jgi:hypothetical protein
MRPMVISSGRVICHIPAEMGIKSVTAAVKNSRIIPTRRRPNLSIIDPITGARRRLGIEVMAIMAPALVAEPVS